jgi:hypothetical protein
MKRESPYHVDMLGVAVLQRLVEWQNAVWEYEQDPDNTTPRDMALPYWDELEKALTAYSCRHRSVRCREAVDWNGTIYVFRPAPDGSWELQDEIGLTM